MERPSRQDILLHQLGRVVRGRREELGLTQKTLAEEAHLSLRYVASLEAGSGNISVARLLDVAFALGTTPARLLAAAEQPQGAPRSQPVVSLLGLRGAGKSSIGAALAAHLGVDFVELDQLLEAAAGMSTGQIFELHGEVYYRRLERETLARFLIERRGSGSVLAAGGGIVTEPRSFDLLRRHTTTVWLKANARDHWDRVIAQGDRRPMANRSEAMSELRALLHARAPLYSRSDLTVDTSALTIDQATLRIVELLGLRRAS